MNWSDQGLVLAVRPHGEGGLVVQLLTRTRGRHAGLVRGGQSGRQRAPYQPGTMVEANWSARLAETSESASGQNLPSGARLPPTHHLITI